jgi:hypothetical protein
MLGINIMEQAVYTRTPNPCMKHACYLLVCLLSRLAKEAVVETEQAHGVGKCIMASDPHE